MRLIQKLIQRAAYIFRRYILRDRFLMEVSRWFKNQGDETLRVDYPLSEKSIVFDVGGYQGDFAAAIHEKYGATVYVFEPVAEFYQHCVSRFAGNSKIICLNYGLSNVNGSLDIHLSDNASSFDAFHSKGISEKVQVHSVVECIKELGLDRIDLMKINIEGGEYDVLPAIIESGDIQKFKFLQIQFHNFIPDARAKRDGIRVGLLQTHTEMWNYEFVWESWKLKNGVD